MKSHAGAYTAHRHSHTRHTRLVHIPNSCARVWVSCLCMCLNGRSDIIRCIPVATSFCLASRHSLSHSVVSLAVGYTPASRHYLTSIDFWTKFSNFSRRETVDRSSHAPVNASRNQHDELPQARSQNRSRITRHRPSSAYSFDYIDSSIEIWVSYNCHDWHIFFAFRAHDVR